MPEHDTCSPVLGAFLRAAGLARLTLVIAGDPGAGWTSTVRAANGIGLTNPDGWGAS